MKTTFVGEKEVGIWWAGAITLVYGQKEITVELCFDGKYKEFRAKTSNMDDYDEACDFENVSERYFAFYNLIEDKIIDEVEEWIEEIEGDKH